MTETEARAKAEAWLRSQSLGAPLVTGRALETRRSWVMETIAAQDHTHVLGNVPLVVDKESGRVRPDRHVWREFVPELPLLHRLRRWWHRRTY